MLSDLDRTVIEMLAGKYGASRVLLFGSSMLSGSEAHDIDLGLSGISAADYFAFCGELMFAAGKPVDVVDLDKDSKFTRLIKKEGISIYEHAA
jgi:predicted nucleotidyltransferase